jgi:hypothetical protein
MSKVRGDFSVILCFGVVKKLIAIVRVSVIFVV